MTKLIDQKLKEKSSQPNQVLSKFANESTASPEKQHASRDKDTKQPSKPPSDVYKNPSLHKSSHQYVAKTAKTCEKLNEVAEKETKNDKEKEEDTRASEPVPDNERHISLQVISTSKLNNPGPKLKRSESLNKPERTISPLTTKVKRSESLSKPGDKLKRSDSLTKTEKTESNINKRREILATGRRLKESTMTKNKRKNGMPDRSIKRRHTVGGTKDPDKVTYIMDNKQQDENNPNAENNKEKGIRTSSPDLSSTRRDKFLIEINLVPLRQPFIRPQSFPESKVFKVPLESHV